MDAFFFWIFSLGMIVCGLAVILNRNPVASALCFASSIVFMSGLFVMLSAFFLAAVQILVTAGAVMVLFLFIIMLLNPEVMEHIPRPKVRMGLALLLGLGPVFLVARTLHEMPSGTATLANASAMGTPAAQTETGDFVSAEQQAKADHMDDTHRIGRLLFSAYVAPFEVTSLLILVATIGVIVICKQEDVPRRTTFDQPLSLATPPKKETRDTELTRIG